MLLDEIARICRGLQGGSRCFAEGTRGHQGISGWVTAFILYPWGDPRDPGGGAGAEFVAVCA